MMSTAMILGRDPLAAGPGASESAAETRLRLVRRAVLRELDRDEQLLILLHYGEAMSLEEVASVLDLTPSQAQGRHDAILAKLRNGIDTTAHAA